MTTDPGDEREELAPEQAFAVLGNQTRIRILHTLGTADGSLSFSELRDRVGLRQGEQFNYHLSKLVGHFVEKTDAGYALRQPGQRVIEAVLSGAITEDPSVDPTPVDWWSCPYCGGEVEVRYRGELLERSCTECPALFREGNRPAAPAQLQDRGNLGALRLPPAGVTGRSADELLAAATTWGYGQWLLGAKGVCPRCAARVDHSITICEDHDEGEGFCTRCGDRYAVTFQADCTNCPLHLGSPISMYLGASPALLSFGLDHGMDPLTDPWDWGWEYDEEVLSTDPFRGRFSFIIDDDALTVTVDEDLEVVEVERE